MLRSYKFRIFPTKAQITKFESWLALCCELYNAGLKERREAYRLNKVSISYIDQQNQLPEIKKIRPELNEIYAQVLQDVLRRLDKAFKIFFSRVKGKEKVGFPRYKNRVRYNSFTFPQGGFSLSDNKLTLSKIGKINIKRHRQIIGKIKILTISRNSCGKWFACFTVETKEQILEPTNKSVGIDLGISTFATLSDSTQIKNPHFGREDEKALARANRQLSKQAKKTKKYRRKQKAIAKIHERIKNRRSNFAHQFSNFLVKNFDHIFFENLSIKKMMGNGYLAKAIGEAAWYQTIEYTNYKAENAGRSIVLVNPKHTSQMCSTCGATVEKELSCRIHHCKVCGLKIDRDYNASLNILALGLKSIRNQSEEAALLIGAE